jgi:hypothetical protein
VHHRLEEARLAPQPISLAGSVSVEVPRRILGHTWILRQRIQNDIASALRANYDALAHFVRPDGTKSGLATRDFGDFDRVLAGATFA